jgi:transcriptional regulator with XRE-family HTH domain
MSEHNLNGSPFSGFSALLYVNFIIKKKYRVDAVAKEMQIASDTLYRYVRGENIMPPDRIIDLVRATGDVEYLEFFCEPCGYIPVTKAQAKLCEASREREEINMTVLWGHALEDIEKAFKDGKLTKKEYGEIHRHLTRLQELAAELDRKIGKEAL